MGFAHRQLDENKMKDFVQGRVFDEEPAGQLAATARLLLMLFIPPREGDAERPDDKKLAKGRSCPCCRWCFPVNCWARTNSSRILPWSESIHAGKTVGRNGRTADRKRSTGRGLLFRRQPRMFHIVSLVLPLPNC